MTATLARPPASASETTTITEARTGFLELSRERVVVYDGSMGATILNMQLTVEDYGGKEGCNEIPGRSMQPGSSRRFTHPIFELGVDVLKPTRSAAA